MEEYKKQTMETYAVNPVGYEKRTRERLDRGVFSLLEKFVSFLNGKKVLDIGCGPGVQLEWLRENGLEAVGIDLSDSFVEICSRKGLNVRKMDMEHINFYPYSFDGILSISSLLHLPKEKVPAVAKSWARLLKPNGVLFLTVKEGTGEGYKEDAVNGGKSKWMSYFSEEEIVKMLSGSFELIERVPDLQVDASVHLNMFFRVRPR